MSIADRASSKGSLPPGEALRRIVEAAGITEEEIGSVERVRISDYQQGYKDSEGEAHVLDLKATQIVISPSWETGPQWEPPSPRNITFKWGGSRAAAPPSAVGLKRLLVLPDTQVHYRMVSDTKRSFSLDPFHDLQAMAAAVSFARYLKPDNACMVGDGMDLPQFGRFTQESAAAEGFNAGLEDMHAWLAALAAITSVDYIEGNHDLRLVTWALNNARAAYGIKRAVDTHSSWPVMTVPFLLSLDDLGVQYHAGYPASYVDYGRSLRAVHGSKVKNKAIHSGEGFAQSIVHGHLHSVFYEHYRHEGPDGPVEAWVGSPGCLCRTDSAVPGVTSATDPRTRRPVLKAQNWQQGMAVVTYDPDSPDTPTWEHVPIRDGVAYWRDQSFVGTLSTDAEGRPTF